MYAKILGDVSSDPYYSRFANNGQKFIAWYLRNVWDYDANQVAHAMTDGPNDNEIDAVIIDNEANKIVVVQGKFLEANSVDAGPLLGPASLRHSIVIPPDVTKSAASRACPNL